MKALKDSKWSVKIIHNGRYWFKAVAKGEIGISGGSIEIFGESTKTETEAKSNWSEFIRVNEIKNWKFADEN